MLSALPQELYNQMRELAAGFLSRERQGHTLQPTALANEACLRMSGNFVADDRVRFLAMAAVTIRHILVDHARRRRAAKRGGATPHLLDASLVAEKTGGVDVLDFDEALERLGAKGGREVSVVVLRVYGGMTLEEAAEALGVSRRTAASDWALARAFLRRELSAYAQEVPG